MRSRFIYGKIGFLRVRGRNEEKRKGGGREGREAERERKGETVKTGKEYVEGCRDETEVRRDGRHSSFNGAGMHLIDSSRLNSVSKVGLCEWRKWNPRLRSEKQRKQKRVREMASVGSHGNRKKKKRVQTKIQRLLICFRFISCKQKKVKLLKVVSILVTFL